MGNKTHYRKVFKSDHLGVADLEDFIEAGKTLYFTIKEVRSHVLDSNVKNSGITVAGRRIGANVAYFKENIKPLVLNSTNSKVVKSFNNGSVWVEDWSNTIIELYIDSNVKMKGEIVGGVRIRPKQPQLKKEKPIFTNDNFEKAHKAKATIELIQKSYTVNAETILKYNQYVTAN